MAANQVTVATPGPAGPTGIIYEGAWTLGNVYQVRDLVRYTDNNLYVCNTQHTATNPNNPPERSPLTSGASFIALANALMASALALIPAELIFVAPNVFN